MIELKILACLFNVHCQEFNYFSEKLETVEECQAVATQGALSAWDASFPQYTIKGYACVLDSSSNKVKI